MSVPLNSGAGGLTLASVTNAASEHIQEVQINADDGAGNRVGVGEPDQPMQVNQQMNGTQNIPFARYLDTVGDGSGGKNANLDFGATPDIFFIQPPAGAIYRISSLVVTIMDATGFTSALYGSLAALTTGIGLRVEGTSGTIVDLAHGVKIKSNAEWHQRCFDTVLTSWGAGDDILAVRWDFRKLAGQMLRLDRDDNAERLEVTLDDDLTGLTGHFFVAHGYKEKAAT